MLKLLNCCCVCLDVLAPDQFSIKGSFANAKPIYLVYGVYQNSHSPLFISSYPTLDEAKEAITQINLAMDKTLIS